MSSSSPTMTHHDTQAQAYGHVAGLLSDAVATDRHLEVQVQPWSGGWRVVVFDHTAAQAVSA